jgi:hypothetical protein
MNQKSSIREVPQSVSQVLTADTGHVGETLHGTKAGLKSLMRGMYRVAVGNIDFKRSSLSARLDDLLYCLGRSFAVQVEDTNHAAFFAEPHRGSPADTARTTCQDNAPPI